MTHLLYSLGPVQGFISASRRTADGWVGSFLLSWLSAEAIAYLESQPGVTVVDPFTGDPELRLPLLDAVRALRKQESFPLDIGDTTIAAVPNRVLLRCPSDQVARELGEKVSAWVNKRWDHLATECWNWLPDSMRIDGVRSLWDSQVASHWEHYWATGELIGDAFRALAARKALRNWQPPSERGDRCTVNAERIALWRGLSSERNGNMLSRIRATAKEDWTVWQRDFVKKGVSRSLIRPDGRERLSAVALIRRVLPYCDNDVRRIWRAGAGKAQASFPSTSSLATTSHRARVVLRIVSETDDVRAEMASRVASFVGKLEDAGLLDDPMRGSSSPILSAARTAIETAANASPDLVDRLTDYLHMDGDLHLVGDAVLEESGFTATDRNGTLEAGDEIRKARAELASSLRRLAPDIGPPPIYYAMLVMDGDGVGDLNQRWTDSGKPAGVLSRAMLRFATAAVELVTKANGRVIYAGGDDLLAVLPILVDGEGQRWSHQVAIDVRNLFRATFANIEGLEQAPTISAALVFAHHQAPLGRVVAAAHQLLANRAKRFPGKNALAMEIFRRAGAEADWVVPWRMMGATDSTTTSPDRFTTLIEGFRQGDLARGLPAKLLLQDWLAERNAMTSDAREVFIANQMKRSRDDSGERKTDDAQLAALAAAVRECAEAGPVGFALEPLRLARFLAIGLRDEE